MDYDYDGLPHLSADHSDYQDSVALGLVPGVRHVGKYGYNANIDSANEQDIWEGTSGTYTGYLLVATTLSIVSTDAKDTWTGVGMRDIVIEGLDEDWKKLSVRYQLAGLVPVVTTEKFIRVFRAYGLAVGTELDNAGEITIDSTGAGTPEMANILAGSGQTLMAIWSSPADEITLIRTAGVGLNSDLAGAAGTREGQAKLWVRSWNDGQAAMGPWRLKRRWNFRNDGSGNQPNLIGLPIKVSPRSDIRASAEVQTNNTSVFVEFGLRLFKV